MMHDDLANPDLDRASQNAKQDDRDYDTRSDVFASIRCSDIAKVHGSGRSVVKKRRIVHA